MSTINEKRTNPRRLALLGDAEGDFAISHYVRATPQKVRRVADLVRGKSVDDAVRILKFAPQAAAEPLLKTIESAAANAANNQNLVRESLVVSAIQINEGPTMKRFRPRAQGRAGRIFKRTSHITVVVTPLAEKGRAR